MTTTKRALFAFLGIFSWTCLASATFYPLDFEVEPNSTIATALANNNLGTSTAPGDGASVEGFLDSGDVDWYAFSVADDAYIGAAAFDNLGVGADAQFQLIDTSGSILAFDDDDGIGFMPSLDANISAGTYLLGVSAFADVTSATGLTELFDGIDNLTGGPTDADFSYKISLVTNVVPEPAAMTLLLIGAGILVIRRYS